MNDDFAVGSNDFEDEYEPCSKKIMPSLFAWFLLISASSAYFTLVLPLFINIIGFDKLYIFVATVILHGLLFLHVLLNFFLSTFMDPGRFPKVDLSEGGEVDNSQIGSYKTALINEINVRMKWCTTCHFYRPPRSSHCGVCNACIDTMDHHCPWVCNCIGRRNYKYFFQFLLSLTIHMMIILAMSLTIVLHNKHNLADLSVIAALLLIIIVGVLLIPIGGLTGFHVILVSRGRTTNEQVTGKFRTGVNPFDKGFVSNCAQTLFAAIPPSYIKFKQQKQMQNEYAQTKILLNSLDKNRKLNNELSETKSNYRNNLNANNDYLISAILKNKASATNQPTNKLKLNANNKIVQNEEKPFQPRSRSSSQVRNFQQAQHMLEEDEVHLEQLILRNEKGHSVPNNNENVWLDRWSSSDANNQQQSMRSKSKEKRARSVEKPPVPVDDKKPIRTQTLTNTHKAKKVFNNQQISNASNEKNIMYNMNDHSEQIANKYARNNSYLNANRNAMMSNNFYNKYYESPDDVNHSNPNDNLLRPTSSVSTTSSTTASSNMKLIHQPANANGPKKQSNKSSKQKNEKNPKQTSSVDDYATYEITV